MSVTHTRKVNRLAPAFDRKRINRDRRCGDEAAVETAVESRSWTPSGGGVSTSQTVGREWIPIGWLLFNAAGALMLDIYNAVHGGTVEKVLVEEIQARSKLHCDISTAPFCSLVICICELVAIGRRLNIWSYTSTWDKKTKLQLVRAPPVWFRPMPAPQPSYRWNSKFSVKSKVRGYFSSEAFFCTSSKSSSAVVKDTNGRHMLCCACAWCYKKGLAAKQHVLFW